MVPEIEVALIIFDLDGTLVNSQYDIRDGINFSLGKLGRSTISNEQVRSMVGGGVKRLVEKAFENAGEKELAEGLRFFEEYYYNNLTTKTTCYPGVQDVLQYFGRTKKAVYSNKPHPLTLKVINQLNLDQYFNIVLGSDPDKYSRKPSPEGVFQILNELKVSPENAIMVGDSSHDIHAAQAAGIRSCAVTYGYRSLEILKKAKPDFVIHKIGDLKSHVAQNVSP